MADSKRFARLDDFFMPQNELVLLSQRELAKLVGTTASVICRLEDADYDGHSLSMLIRIAPFRDPA